MTTGAGSGGFGIPLGAESGFVSAGFDASIGAAVSFDGSSRPFFLPIFCFWRLVSAFSSAAIG